MKNIYKPMLYSTPMVQGILESRKNQTRRTKGLDVINLNPDKWNLLTSFDNPEDLQSAFYFKNGKKDQQYLQFKSDDKYFDAKVPYQVDEIIWVRETFVECIFKSFWYKASDEMPGDCWKWTPSIHMPKKACRIFLKVIQVRVERLKDITVWAAEAEGVEMRLVDGHEEFKNYLAEGVTEDEPWGDSYFSNNPRLSFMSLWQSINGIESWDLNPWVWVIKFEKIDKPNDFI